MSEIWVPITIAAAFSQNVRNALQKHLTTNLSTAGATQVRFLYAIPFATLYLVFLCYGADYKLPNVNMSFAVYAVVGAVSQIFATELLVKLFAYRNFFIGTTYSKTESLQTAALGFFVLSDKLTFGAIAGIAIGIIGVAVISSTKNKFSLVEILKSLCSKTAAIGIFSGFLFAVASVSYRGACISLDGDYVIKAAFTLITVLVFQSILVMVYLLKREEGQMTLVLKNWRISWLVGLSGMLASVGWFTAMAIQNAAHVRALGQVELAFAFLASAFVFKERVSKIELIGVSFIVFGVLVLLAYK